MLRVTAPFFRLLILGLRPAGGLGERRLGAQLLPSGPSPCCFVDPAPMAPGRVLSAPAGSRAIEILLGAGKRAWHGGDRPSRNGVASLLTTRGDGRKIRPQEACEGARQPMRQPKKKATTGKQRQSRPKQENAGEPAAQLIDARIEELGDWRGEMLARIRILIKQADPEVVEEWKWRGVPVWSHAGIICTGETYKNVVKMTFAKGASLQDPTGLFNSSLEGNTRRAIDFHAGDKIDAKALQALIRAAVALNTAARQPRKRA